MKRIIPILIVFVLVGAVIGAVYFSQSKDLVSSDKRIDTNTLERKTPEVGWQSTVELYEHNYSDSERDEIRKKMGPYYQHIKAQPWNSENLDPYSNGNAKLVLSLQNDSIEGSWLQTYINIDLHDVVDDFEKYLGELIYLEQNRLIDYEFFESGSEESVAVTGGEEFAVHTYEDIYGTLFKLLILPPGAKNYHESIIMDMDADNVETQLRYVLGCSVGIIDGNCVVLATPL